MSNEEKPGHRFDLPLFFNTSKQFLTPAWGLSSLTLTISDKLHMKNYQDSGPTMLFIVVFVCRLFKAVKHSTQPCRGTLDPRVPFSIPIRLHNLN